MHYSIVVLLHNFSEVSKNRLGIFHESQGLLVHNFLKVSENGLFSLCLMHYSSMNCQIVKKTYHPKCQKQIRSQMCIVHLHLRHSLFYGTSAVNIVVGGDLIKTMSMAPLPMTVGNTVVWSHNSKNRDEPQSNISEP